MRSGAPVVLPALERSDRDRDAELVERARGGDRWAEEALYRAHVRDIARVATRVLGATADADDVVQETFLRALTRLDRLRDGRALGGWLARIALNLVRGRLRRRRLWKMVGIDAGEEDAGLAELASPGLDPEGRAELAKLDERLRAMPAENRMAWTLRHVEGWSLDEVAAGLGRSLATTKRRLQAAEAAIAEGRR